MKIKDYFKIFQKITAIMILSAMFGIAGCGAAESDVGQADAGEKDVVQAESSTETTEAAPVDSPSADEVTEESDADEAEDILAREKPAVVNMNGHVFRSEPTNKFIMINEIEDGEYINYVTVKGTLYEVFLDGEPDYDLVYFPDDELPEGYEVKVTEDYEAELYGDRVPDGSAFLPTEDKNHKMSYKYYVSCCITTQDLDPNITLKDAEWVGPAVEPGMYGSLAQYDVDGMSGAEFIQYLLKDQIPEGVELDDDIVHQ